jgi:hypothetical protein
VSLRSKLDDQSGDMMTLFVNEAYTYPRQDKQSRKRQNSLPVWMELAISATAKMTPTNLA